MSQSKSQVKVVRFKELDVHKYLSIGKPVLNPNNSVYNASILYDSAHLILETPYLKNPFGLTKFMKGSGMGYSITLMSTGTYTDGHDTIQAFFAQLKKIDELMIEYGERYSETLFGKKMTRVEVKAIYEPGVRGKMDATGNPYPDKISPKVIVRNNGYGVLPKIVVFKNSKVPIDIYSMEDFEALIEKGMSLRGIIQPRIYLMKDKFGLVYEYHQIKLPSITTKKQMETGDYCFSE